MKKLTLFALLWVLPNVWARTYRGETFSLNPKAYQVTIEARRVDKIGSYNIDAEE